MHSASALAHTVAARHPSDQSVLPTLLTLSMGDRMPSIVHTPSSFKCYQSSDCFDPSESHLHNKKLPYICSYWGRVVVEVGGQTPRTYLWWTWSLPPCFHWTPGTALHTFCTLSHTNIKAVLLEEQVTIFLYAWVTGLTIWHVGERFQRSNNAISRWEQVSKGHESVFIITIAISKRCSSFSHWILSITDMCACQQQAIQFHMKFATIQDSGPSLRTVWALWTAVTFPVHLLCWWARKSTIRETNSKPLRDWQQVLGGVKHCEWTYRPQQNTIIGMGALLGLIGVGLASISLYGGAVVPRTGWRGCTGTLDEPLELL
jgi:hypothetical protein